MVFASNKKLPFIYSDTFIVLAIVTMALLAVICFVIIPLFILKRTPTRKPYLIVTSDHTVKLNDELSKYFASITVKDFVVTLVRLKGIEKVRVALYYPHLINNKYLIYDLDFSSGDVLKIHYPKKHKMLTDIRIVDDNCLTIEGKKLTTLKKSRLWIFAIGVGVTFSISTLLMVVIYSTHLRNVSNSYGANYAFASIGLILIPLVYFGMYFLNKRLEKRGK